MSALRIGLVTRWGVPCGVADYAESLARTLATDGLDIVVLADDASVVPAGGRFDVVRCWHAGEPDITRLITATTALSIDVLLVQHHVYLSGQALDRLLVAAREAGIRVIVELHGSVIGESARALLGEPAARVDLADAVIVHSTDERDALLDSFPGCVAAVSPLPQSRPVERSARTVREALGIHSDLVVGTFGLLLPHKGVQECIAAIPALEGAGLLVVGGISPLTSESIIYLQRCRGDVARLGLGERVRFTRHFLSQAAATFVLQATDAIVLPYSPTGEPASAAVRFALSSGRPVITTDLPIFDALGDAVYRIPDTEPATIAAAVRAVVDDSVVRDGLLAAAVTLGERHSWGSVGRRFATILRGDTKE